MTEIKKNSQNCLRQFFKRFINLTILYLEECQTATTQHLP